MPTTSKGKTTSKGNETPEVVVIPVEDRTINGFECVNEEKFDRVINGSMTSQGTLTGGVGTSATPEKKLAEYDRLGGLIRFANRKVKTGSFWDFKAGKAVENPEPLWVIRAEGEIVEIPVGEQLPPEVQASELIAKKKADKVAAVVEKKGKKPNVEDEE